MRLTTTSRRSAAVAATAGLALLFTGCSSSEPAAAPVVPRPVQAEPAADKTPAKKVSPRKQLAKAMRASLAAQTASFRARLTARYVDPQADENGRNRNPIEAISGTLNFKRNMAVVHLVSMDNSAQPTVPIVTVLQKGRKLFGGLTEDVNNGGTWDQTFSGDGVDEFVDVLSNVKGKVRIERKNAKLADGATGMTVYTMRVDVGRSLLDSGVASTRSLGRSLVGQTALQRVWVDQDGRIAKMQAVFRGAQVPAVGLDSADVKSVTLTMRVNNYGVDMVFPPHPTEV